MGLSLKIQNMTNLPDGGPLEVDVPGKSGIDIGRDQHLDWTLPDPTRFISGKHCEIRYKDNAYWLHDVSTNGTFLNGAEERMRSPHRLRTGDRLEIGDYIVAVTIDTEQGAAIAAKEVFKAPDEDLWHVADEVAAPLAIEPLRPARRDMPATSDFLERLVETSGPANDAIWNDAAQPGAGGKLFDFDWTDAPKQKPRQQDLEPMPVDNPELTSENLDASLLQERDRRLPSTQNPPLVEFLPTPAPSASKPRAERPIEPAPSERPDASRSDFVKLVAQGAGVHESVFARYTAAELAEVLGVVLRMTALNLQQLLSARSELKDVVRSSSHTTIVKANNNPLKFSPDVEEALRMMFAPSSSSYLDAQRAIEQSFNDLKQHQGQIFAAMQDAIRSLQTDLDPTSIEAEVERGLGSIVVSRKAKLWDTYVVRWRMSTARHENGLLGVFLNYFAASYDRSASERRS